ncbi:helix-turn-helix domain-containing protein [Kribbella pratensis]|uniref:TetR family transcriptional regulator n=1 Tax=Kribbella pratensis TaxID=2512112 RepID=A0A4R8CKA5_9ACTN|nr:helix-turn-helix domain-containing protein [Kribbella pratensis]TDW74973.1 TetR family transcriptional regulator [Kribbella pratensis]
MSDTAAESGRVRQRRRTRAAIVNAAAELLRQGQIAPGVNEIAEAAEVSRRTIYQYFPTLDQLLLDATIGLLTQTDVDAAIEAASRHADTSRQVAASGQVDAPGQVDASRHTDDAGGADAAARVDAMIRALGDATASSLPLGRSLIRLTVDAPAVDTTTGNTTNDAAAGGAPEGRATARGATARSATAGSATADGVQPKRGYRRIAWIEQALDPLRAGLDDDLFEQLVSGIAMVVGWEALIVLQDLRGLEPDAQTRVSTWAARSLIQSTLDEQRRRTTP